MGYHFLHLGHFLGELRPYPLQGRSFDLQVSPFLDAGVPTSIAVSPTKAFITFAYRPCGFLLVYNPEPAKDKEVTLAEMTRVPTTVKAETRAVGTPKEREAGRQKPPAARAKAVATAASTALPPERRISMAIWVARGWLVAATPSRAMTCRILWTARRPEWPFAEAHSLLLGILLPLLIG